MAVAIVLQSTTRETEQKLEKWQNDSSRGALVAGWACTDNEMSLCKLLITQKMLNEDLKHQTEQADSTGT